VTTDNDNYKRFGLEGRVVTCAIYCFISRGEKETFYLVWAGKKHSDNKIPFQRHHQITYLNGLQGPKLVFSGSEWYNSILFISISGVDGGYVGPRVKIVLYMSIALPHLIINGINTALLWIHSFITFQKPVIGIFIHCEGEFARIWSELRRFSRFIIKRGLFYFSCIKSENIIYFDTIFWLVYKKYIYALA